MYPTGCVDKESSIQGFVSDKLVRGLFGRTKMTCSFSSISEGFFNIINRTGPGRKFV